MATYILLDPNEIAHHQQQQAMNAVAAVTINHSNRTSSSSNDVSSFSPRLALFTDR